MPSGLSVWSSAIRRSTLLILGRLSIWTQATGQPTLLMLGGQRLVLGLTTFYQVTLHRRGLVQWQNLWILFSIPRLQLRYLIYHLDDSKLTILIWGHCIKCQGQLVFPIFIFPHLRLLHLLDFLVWVNWLITFLCWQVSQLQSFCWWRGHHYAFPTVIPNFLYFQRYEI